MRSFELTIDLGGRLPVPGPATVAATLHLPDRDSVDAVVFAYPGGGFGRRYFDLRLQGLSGYSQAEHLTARGVALVACDHLGLGESSPLPDPAHQTIEVLADANAAAVPLIVAALGRLVPEVRLPAAGSPRFVGLGHSLGGCLLVAQQARHASFGALMILGSSGRHTAFPAETGGGIVDVDFPSRGQDPLLNPPSRPFTRAEKRYTYYADDVPASLAEVDLDANAFNPGGSRLVRGSAEVPWGSPNRPACASTMCSPGVVAAEAARIDVPLFVGLGERDVVAEPLLELTAYPKVSDFTMVTVAGMSHIHNFAGSRAVLWDRIAGWISARRGSTSDGSLTSPRVRS
ncbi:alpha/beta fold hydrolase [Jatrophihabitans sp.]|uniref:alpha/beta hydrolase n=1 Tax=Jatrophihabitans sp. TaxID=1932789 RepID=UPI0030C71042|nr:hypothetical protein [Jatrophihabitans sp.]